MKYIRGDITVVRVFLPVGENKFKFVQRSAESEYNKNLWELPGGKLKSAEEDPYDIPEEHIEGAIRRIFEGTGFIIKMSGNLELVERRIMKDPVRKDEPYVSYVGTGEIVGGSFQLSDKYQASDNLDIEPLNPLYEYTPDAIGAVALHNRKFYHH